MTSFYREVERATNNIDHHAIHLMEELDGEYEPLFQSLLDEAQDFGEADMADFRNLGRLKRSQM